MSNRLCVLVDRISILLTKKMGMLGIPLYTQVENPDELKNMLIYSSDIHLVIVDTGRGRFHTPQGITELEGLLEVCSEIKVDFFYSFGIPSKEWSKKYPFVRFRKYIGNGSVLSLLESLDYSKYEKSEYLSNYKAGGLSEVRHNQKAIPCELPEGVESKRVQTQKDGLVDLVITVQESTADSLKGHKPNLDY